MSSIDADLRKAWRAYHTAREQASAEWAANGYQYPPPQIPPMPDELKRLRCGARTRAGTPCKRAEIYISGRCHLHGGASTGPRTRDGKARSALNGRVPKRTP